MAADGPAAPVRGPLVGSGRRPGHGRLRGGETPVELHLRLDRAGRITSLAFDRWGDPDGDGFGWHRFGGEITGYASFGGLTIPSAGRLGWHPGGDRFSDGEFLRYRITELQPVGPAGAGGAEAGTR